MWPRLPLPEEEAVVLFSYQRTALFRCCSLKTAPAGKKQAPQKTAGAAASQKGWRGGGMAERPEMRAVETPWTFLQIHSVPDGQAARERFLFPSCISKELAISHPSDTEKLISKLDFNWVWEQLTNCSSLPLQFVPVFHSCLIYFTIFNSCFAIVSLLTLSLPLAAQSLEKAPIFHVHLSQAMWGNLSQQRHLHGDALQRDHLSSEQNTGYWDRSGTPCFHPPSKGTEEMDG